MDNDCLLNHGDDNGEIGAVATVWPDVRLTRADPGAELGERLGGQLLSGCPEAASVFGLESFFVNNSRLSSRGKPLSSLTALVSNVAGEGQTLFVWWNKFFAPCLAALNSVIVQSAFGNNKPSGVSRDWNPSRCTSHCPVAMLLAALMCSAISCWRSPDPCTNSLCLGDFRHLVLLSST